MSWLFYEDTDEAESDNNSGMETEEEEMENGKQKEKEKEIEKYSASSRPKSGMHTNYQCFFSPQSTYESYSNNGNMSSKNI